MISRYKRKIMDDLWTEKTKFDTYLKIELLNVEALYEKKLVSKEDLEKSREELFNTTNQTLQAFATMLNDIVDKNQYCVFTNPTAAEKNKGLFKDIVTI